MVRTLHGRRTYLVAACVRKSRQGETVDVTMLARDASLAHRVRIAPPSPDVGSEDHGCAITVVHVRRLSST